MGTKILLWMILFFHSSYLLAQTTIEIKKLTNFDSGETARVMRVVKNIQHLINTKEFENQIIMYRINGEFRFENSNGDSNQKVYDKIMSGYELLDERIDKNWTLHLSLRWLFSFSVTAYTTFTSPEIVINSRYYRRSRDFELAGTICHEYMHKLGYSHDKKWTSTRPHSVPYAVGDICENLYVGMFNVEYEVKDRCDLICWLKGLLDGGKRGH